MPILIISLMLTAAMLGVTISRAHLATLRQTASSYNARIFRPGFDHAIADAVQAANQLDTTMNGAYAGPFPAIHTTYPACGDAAAQGLGCNTTVDETVTWASDTVTGATDHPETLANVNVGNSDSGKPNENFAAGTIALKMIGPGGNTVAQRTGTFKLRLMNTPPQFATLESFQDAAGNSTGSAGEGQNSGRCPTADPTCTAGGMDVAQQNATADDSRFATAHICYDPDYSGNGGANPADKCHPSGDPAYPLHYDNAFGTKALDSNKSTTGWRR